MRRGRKAILALVIVLVLVLGAVSSFHLTRVPEPEYNGVKLGSHLALNPVVAWKETAKTLNGLGPKAVPYLVSEMRPNPAYELVFRIAPGLPSSLQRFIPDKRKYDDRRRLASSFLWHLDTDAVTALPEALRAVERKDAAILNYCINIVGWHARGTPYEARAVQALIAALDSKEAGARRSALQYLQRMNVYDPQIVSVLIREMYEPGMGETCLNSLVRFGTNALPALRKAAEDEKKGHVRPAEIAIERIEQQARKGGPTGLTIASQPQ